MPIGLGVKRAETKAIDCVRSDYRRLEKAQDITGVRRVVRGKERTESEKDLTVLLTLVPGLGI